MTSRPPHPFVMLARRMTTREAREYLTALGWEGSTSRDTWHPPATVAFHAGRIERLADIPAEEPHGNFTTRAALLTAMQHEAERLDREEETLRAARRRLSELGWTPERPGRWWGGARRGQRTTYPTLKALEVAEAEAAARAAAATNP